MFARRYLHNTCIWLLTSLVFTVISEGWAAELAPLNIPAIEIPPELDGVLDDAVWRTAVKVDKLYIYNSGEAVNDTIIYLAHDDAWLYFGICASNPSLGKALQTAFEHDGPVNRDDSIEIFIRPAMNEDNYYQFALNSANIRRDQRCRPGWRDEDWNPLWRSATKKKNDGWTAEIAIPLFIFERDDLSGMALNICRNKVVVELDAYGAIMGQTVCWHTIHPENKGGFHNLHNFQRTSGLGGFTPVVPDNVPTRILSAEALGWRHDAGNNYYEVKLTLETAPVPGAIKALIIEETGNGANVKTSRLIDEEGTRELLFKVVADDFSNRQVKVRLVSATNESMIAEQSVANLSNLNIIRKAFVVRSYYTDESDANVRLESSLPDELLRQLSAIAVFNNANILQVKELQSSMTLDIPMQSMELGENIISLRIMYGQKEIASKNMVITRLVPRPGREVKADFLKGVILKDGSPFFPLGIYVSGVNPLKARDSGEDIFKLLGDAGFNTVIRMLDFPDEELFARMADKYGLEVITWSYPDVFRSLKYSVPAKSDSLSLKERMEILRAGYNKAESDVVRETENFSSEPNMLAYYNVDEPNLGNRDERIAVAEWYWNTVHAIDPYRPVFLLYSKYIPTGSNWTRWGDILGYDVYPRPFTGGMYSEPGFATVSHAWQLRERCRQDRKIMWFVPLSNILDPWRSPVGMNKSHMLCQAYASVIYGARGLLYFSLRSVLGPDAWEALRTINAHFKAMTPALVNGDVPQNISYAPDDYRPAERKFPMVNAAVCQYPDGDYLLLAVNIKPHAVKAQFVTAGLQHAVRLFDDDCRGEWTCAGEMLTDKIEPYGVRAYRMQLDGHPSLVKVAVNMEASPEEVAPSVDVQGIIRRVMSGKNYIANPCFDRQFLPGIPDFFLPSYYSQTYDPEVGKKGSTWYLDDEMLWQGHASLKMTTRAAGEFGPSVYSTLGVAHIPNTARGKGKVTFSFYARGQAADTGIRVILFSESGGLHPDGSERLTGTFSLTPAWRRYHVTGPAPGPRASSLILLPAEGSTVWINGLQLESGDKPTEFSGDSILADKIVPSDSDNLVVNPGAEYGTAGWEGLEDIRRNELGIRPGMGHTGENAFYWRGQSFGINSDWFAVDPAKKYELSGWFNAESGVFTGIWFSVGIQYVDGKGNRYNVMACDNTGALMKPKSADTEIPCAEIPAAWTELKGTIGPLPRAARAHVIISGPGIKRDTVTQGLLMDDFSFKVSN